MRVLCVGCWDILHYGHLRHLEKSRTFGSYLTVAVTKNRSVRKGAGRPVNDEKHRKALLQALWCVDRVILVDSSLEALRKVKPHVFALGKDYVGKVLEEDREYCRKHGVTIRFTNEYRMSSTKIHDRVRQG